MHHRARSHLVEHVGGLLVPLRPTGYRVVVFFFFSNRLGCLGSLVVSLVVTGALVLLLWR